MPLYMLDTDISSFVIKRSNPSVLSRLQKTAVADVCISVITKSELLYGIEVSPRKQRNSAALDEFLRYVDVLEFPVDAAIHYGQIRAELKVNGNLIGANDLLIAAHARCLGLTLVTNNTREFKRVTGLMIENWASPAFSAL